MSFGHSLSMRPLPVALIEHLCYYVGVKRKRGAPKGNQNARKHRFYSAVLDQNQQLDMLLVEGVHGVDEEIALFRVKMKSILEHDPENIKLILQATNILNRLVKNNSDKGDKEEQLKKAIGNVLQDAASMIGAGVSDKMKKLLRNNKFQYYSNGGETSDHSADQ